MLGICDKPAQPHLKKKKTFQGYASQNYCRDLKYLTDLILNRSTLQTTHWEGLGPLELNTE